MTEITFHQILDQENELFESMEMTLESMIKAAKEKDSSTIAKRTEELSNAYEQADVLDNQLLDLASSEADKQGIPIKDFKLSMIDGGAEYSVKLDEVRERVKTVAILAAKAGGVLSANVSVIEETIKVLENLDQQSVSYSKDSKSSKPKRPSKLLDTTA